jgi:type I restriction enzyme S subunit
MAGEWQTRSLGSLADLHQGQVVPGDHPERVFRHFSLPAFDDGQRPVLESGASIGSQKFTVPENALLVSKLNPRIPRVWEVNTSGAELPVASTEFLVLLPRRGISRRFLKYICLGPAVRSELAARVTGTSGSHQRVRPDDVLALEVNLPTDLQEQQAIAHILGTLDDKVELNRRMSETLEAMARALFKSWFVDFDPVRAKAEGRDPGLPRPLADLFPARLVDSELGEIPEGWQTGPILDHARLMSGGTPKTDRSEYWDGSIAWASAKDVSQSRETFLVATERTITDRGLEESATQMVPAFCTVVVARGATTGRMVLFGCDMAMNQTCYAFASTTETPFALYCRLHAEIDALVHAAHGSVFDTITTSTFTSSRIVLPPKALLKAFEERGAPLFLRVLQSTRETRTLAVLRDTLLPKLISGELRIEDAERFIGRAV